MTSSKNIQKIFVGQLKLSPLKKGGIVSNHTLLGSL
jgi:hypothetical protein